MAYHVVSIVYDRFMAHLIGLNFSCCMLIEYNQGAEDYEELSFNFNNHGTRISWLR